MQIPASSLSQQFGQHGVDRFSVTSAQLSKATRDLVRGALSFDIIYRGIGRRRRYRPIFPNMARPDCVECIWMPPHISCCIFYVNSYIRFRPCRSPGNSWTSDSCASVGLSWHKSGETTKLLDDRPMTRKFCEPPTGPDFGAPIQLPRPHPPPIRS